MAEFPAAHARNDPPAAMAALLHWCDFITRFLSGDYTQEQRESDAAAWVAADQRERQPRRIDAVVYRSRIVRGGWSVENHMVGVYLVLRGHYRNSLRLSGGSEEGGRGRKSSVLRVAWLVAGGWDRFF